MRDPRDLRGNGMMHDQQQKQYSNDYLREEPREYGPIAPQQAPTTEASSLSLVAILVDKVRSVLHNMVPQCEHAWVVVAVHVTAAICMGLYLLSVRSKQYDGVYLLIALAVAVHWFLFGSQCVLEWVNTRLRRMCSSSSSSSSCTSGTRMCAAVLSEDDARRLAILWVVLLVWWAIALLLVIVRNTTSSPDGWWTTNIMMGAVHAINIQLQMQLFKRVAIAIEWK